MGTENKPRVPRSGSKPTRVKTGDADPAGTATGGSSASTLDSGMPTQAAREAQPESVVRLPKPKWLRRRRNWLIGVGCAVVVIASLITAVIFTPMFAVRDISVDGNKLASDEAILQQLESLWQVPLAQISTSEVETLLSDVPQVRSVSIEARPPSELRVHIDERVPVAVLKDGGEFALIDRGGTRLGTVAKRGKVQLPLIDGDQEDLGKEIFRTTTAVLAALPEDILSRLDHASADSVDSVELTLHNGKTVMWGNAERNRLKSQVLTILLEESRQKPAAEEPAEPEAPVEVYDVSSPERPVTR